MHTVSAYCINKTLQNVVSHHCSVINDAMSVAITYQDSLTDETALGRFRCQADRACCLVFIFGPLIWMAGPYRDWGMRPGCLWDRSYWSLPICY